jgi:hypothetical protein
MGEDEEFMFGKVVVLRLLFCSLGSIFAGCTHRPKLVESWWLLDYFLTAIAIAWLAAFQWVLMCWLMEEAGK